MLKINLIATATKTDVNSQFQGEITLENHNGQKVILSYLCQNSCKNEPCSCGKYSFKESLISEKPVADILNLFHEKQNLPRLKPLKFILKTIKSANILSDVAARLIKDKPEVLAIGKGWIELDSDWYKLIFHKVEKELIY